MKNEIFTEKSQPVQVAASCIVPYPGIVYRNGSSGPNVVLIQNWLNGIAGTYPAIKTITVDGKFGNNTQTQVEVFQTMWGLTIDGAVGTNTWTKLNSVYCNVLAGQINPITPKYIGYPLYPGSTGSYVKTIQYMLNVCHSYYTQIPLLVIDGNWGNQTTLAVKTFQGIVGLKQDGVVGRETWGSLVYVYTEIMNGQIPTPIDPDAYPGYPTKIGDVNSNVAKIQSWLNIVAQYYSPVKTLVVDSYFGPATEAEVMAFQSMFGLKEDGIVGEITWDTLVGIKTSLEEQVIVPITPKYIGYPVSQGATGNYVKNIQYMLNTVKAVYPSIPLLTVDGIYGSITAAAVREYQRLSSLTVDGVVGQITFNSLLSKYTEVIRGVVPPTDQYPGFPIKLGDNNQYVNTIQTWLAGIAPHYTPIKNTTVDNYFGIGTFNDVTAFQNMFSLAETGIVEETTWNGLKFVYNSYMGGNITPISPTYPGAPLRVGSSGNSVKSTQYMLNVIALTYTQIVTLKVDGAYGVKTRNSVITFQNLFGLTPDGVVGLNTWNKIIAVYTSLIS
ncbi:MAG: peptidoglycan-binding protein [Clostridia bacterium]